MNFSGSQWVEVQIAVSVQLQRALYDPSRGIKVLSSETITVAFTTDPEEKKKRNKVVIFVIFGTKCIFNASINSNGPSDVTCLEEIEKQKAKERYMKMHLAGKTDQAKADLARLAIIRKQREEAARKKEEERIFQSILT
uniref:Pdgfa associated protein 1b n=1 Tax=Cyprinus carpio TaxID=7962 RepID=A0A8C1ICD0_CYPCA